MDRRLFLAIIPGGLLAAALPAEAQPAAVPRIGWLVYGGPFTEASRGLEAAVLRELKERGYEDGRNLKIEYRHAEGRSERLPELAAELVRSKVNLLLALGGDVALALRRATTSIPIVVATSTDPVRSQLIASLAHPGGNLTGVTFVFDELAAKRVELLKEVMPRLSRLAVLWDPTHVDNDFPQVEIAARRLGLQLQSLEIRGPNELESALRAAINGRAEALLVVPGRLTGFLSRRIIEGAAQSKIPVISGWREFAESGAVLTYGPDRVESAKRTVIYVDRILKGARPGDLPVEQPTKFELVVNLKAAKALGLSVPRSVLQRTDQVIE
ncbi:MAG TPA: ABC transporter substrate-binding protein [Candidatus Nitrosocosmicus sp.]|jgi:putative ABC transport system substrate-binding protein|nr:ABC transporter substrate-binding protein [Candidatus Nitrosocosmicus sp.]